MQFLLIATNIHLNGSNGGLEFLLAAGFAVGLVVALLGKR